MKQAPRLTLILLFCLGGPFLGGCLSFPLSIQRDPDGRPLDSVTSFRIGKPTSLENGEAPGWAAPAGEPAILPVEQPFRIRFEVESPESVKGPRALDLQVRRNDGPWQTVLPAEFPLPEERTPLVSRVSPRTSAAEPTANLLSGSSLPHRPGKTVGLKRKKIRVSHSGASSEWEWNLVIRRYGDGPLTTEEGDRFTFRLVDAGGAPLPARAHPQVTAHIPDGLLAGTFVETPGPIGPWQAANGHLYFIMEPAETDNVMMIVRSTDGGSTWAEVDGTNRPATGDLEGVASVFFEGVLYILHQTSDEVLLHAFATTDPTTAPNSWLIRDEVLARPPEPPVQAVALAARPDGSLVALYAGPEKIHLQIRDRSGTWSDPRILDAGTNPVHTGPQAVTGSDGIIHIAYTGNDGSAFYRRLLIDGTLTPSQRFADDLGTREEEWIGILPLRYLEASNTLVVIYRNADGLLVERRLEADDTFSSPRIVSNQRVVSCAVDSDQAGADLIHHREDLFLLFIDEESRALYRTQSRVGGPWSKPVRIVGGIDGSWVRGQVVRSADGSLHYGFVYDAGSKGGSGLNRFASIPIE